MPGCACVCVCMSCGQQRHHKCTLLYLKRPSFPFLVIGPAPLPGVLCLSPTPTPTPTTKYNPNPTLNLTRTRNVSVALLLRGRGRGRGSIWMSCTISTTRTLCEVYPACRHSMPWCNAWRRDVIRSARRCGRGADRHCMCASCACVSSAPQGFCYTCFGCDESSGMHVLTTTVIPPEAKMDVPD